ncbi:RidA family protein [Actinokineospora sp. HUAS TT18]|uniref:RidA family protein n=1 Tax=Actinokineospora sp. HUAS TT18 TaxID=3447451 RepID=UPI003F52333E
MTTIERRNPPGLHETPGYHHLTLVGGTAFLAGQCPLDHSGALVGEGDVLAQTDQVVANIMTALTDAGLTPDDVVRTVIYVATAEQAVLGRVWARLQESPLAPAFKSASTLLGVAVLGFTGQLVEIDVTAVRA